MEFSVFNPFTLDFNISYLEWELSPTIEDLNNYVFIVRRGKVQEQLEIIDVLGSQSNLYTDTTISGFQYDKQFQLYYQLEAFHLTDDSKSIYSDIKALNEPALNWAAKEIIRRDTIGLRDVMGQKFTLLKRRSTGQQCSCWDSTLGEKVVPGTCFICYDTNWVGGYYNPVTIYGSIGPWGESSTITLQGDQKDSSTMFKTTYYPKLNVNDVIIDTAGNRWRVFSLSAIRLNSAQIKQIVQISIIDRSDPVYKLAFNQTYLPNNTLLVANTSKDWSNINPILEADKFGLESDTLRLKQGDGVTAWNNLEYFDLSGQFILASGRYIVGTLSGDINGINKTFITGNNFIAGTTNVFKNGLKQRLNFDYIEVAPNTILFEDAPSTTGGLDDRLEIIYGIM